MSLLKDKVAVITGGSNGIGKATADSFLNEGAKVIIWDISVEKGEALAESYRTDGYDVFFQQVDTSNPEQVEAATQEAINRYGRIYILVNNAGIHATLLY
mgnify:CR=1 FL=1